MLNRRLLSKEIQSGIRYLYFGLGLVILASAAMYIFSLSDSGYQGYIFSQHQLNAAKLQEDKELLEQQLLDLKSQKYLDESELIEHYVSAPDPMVLDSRQERLTKR